MSRSGKSEKTILNETLCDLSALPETIAWRNNSGMAWQGRQRTARIGSTIIVEPGMVILAEARPVKFGLTGSADIIGAHRHYPLAVEVKDDAGRQDPQQILFEQAWKKAGGVYFLVRSAEEALRRIRDLL